VYFFTRKAWSVAEFSPLPECPVQDPSEAGRCRVSGRRLGSSEKFSESVGGLVRRHFPDAQPVPPLRGRGLRRQKRNVGEPVQSPLSPPPTPEVGPL